MVLSDEQKLIIATLCIQKQVIVDVDTYTRVQQVTDYCKSLNIDVPQDIYSKITSEEMNFIVMLQTDRAGLLAWNSNSSDFSLKTKFCIYACEMILMQGEPPVEVAVRLENTFRKICKISLDEQDIILTEIIEHLDTVIEYIGYWLGQHDKQRL